MLTVEGTVVNEGLMLSNSRFERDIIILAPSTEGVEEEDRVLVALSNELLTSVLKEEAMSIMEGVSNLEGVDGISISFNHHVVNLLRSHSVVIESIIPHDVLKEVSGLSRDEPVSLGHNVLSHRVALLEASESSGADFFLSVFEEGGVVDDSNNVSFPGESDVLGVTKGFLLCGSEVLYDRDRHEVSLSVLGDSLHVHGLEEFHFVHESSKRESPSFSNSLEEFSLHLVEGKTGVLHSIFTKLGISNDEGIDNSSGSSVSDNSS